MMVRNTEDEMNKLVKQNLGKKKGRRNNSGNRSSDYSESNVEEEMDSVTDSNMRKRDANQFTPGSQRSAQKQLDIY